MSDNVHVNKKKRVKKPWWNEHLTVLFNEMCHAEKVWKRGKIFNSSSSNLKSNFVSKRRVFDRQVQRAKREYWYSLQRELLIESKTDQHNFWKKIGKIGIATDRKSSIPMEVVDSHGNVSTNVDDVLEKWKSEYSILLNQPTSEVNADVSNLQDQNSGDVLTLNDFLLTDEISFEEVVNAVNMVKMGKASGIDNIPADVLCNQSCVIFFHKLFNSCFSTGKVPDLWNNIIINPIPKSNMSDKRDPLCYRGIALAPSSYKLYCNILNTRLSQ